MRFYALFAAMLLSGSIAFAQNDDPTIMTINGQPVSRSEFEYSYNKNNSEGVIDKKTVNEIDGARVVFCVIEWIRKKPVSRKVEGIIHAVGLIVILGFAILVDILQFIW